MWTGIGVAAGALGGALISKGGTESAAETQANSTGKAVAETGRQYNQTRQDLAPYREAGSAALTRLRSLLGLGGAGSGVVDESDPRYKAIYQPMVDQFDADHQAKFGIGIYDSRADATSRDATLERFKQQARDQFTSQYGGNTQSTQDSPLLRKFTQGDLESDVPYNAGLQFGLDEGRKAIERRSSATGGYDSGGTLKALTRFGNDYGTTKAEGAYNRFVGNQGDVYGRLSGVAGMGAGATNVGVNAGSNSSSNLANLYTGQGNAQAASQIAGANALGGGVNSIGNYIAQQSLLRQLTGGGARTLVSDPALTGAGDLNGSTG